MTCTLVIWLPPLAALDEGTAADVAWLRVDDGVIVDSGQDDNWVEAWEKPHDTTPDHRLIALAPAADVPKPRPALLPKLAGPVYVLTDSTCMSACLDAVDLWTALGAIQVGRATGADTLYMEVRQVKLPSGLTQVSMPMKVYRGRARGSNEPALPKYRFDGDIGDTAALERWIAGLPDGRRR